MRKGRKCLRLAVFPYALRITHYSPYEFRGLSEDTPHTVNRDVPLLDQLREEEVQHDDRDEALHEAFGARAADAAGAAAAGEAFVATNEPNRAAEEEALEPALEDLPRVHALRRVIPVRLRGDAEELRRDHVPAQ